MNIEFINLMKALRGKYPSMRIGQLIINAIEFNGRSADSIYYMNDADLEACIKRYLQVNFKEEKERGSNE